MKSEGYVLVSVLILSAVMGLLVLSIARLALSSRRAVSVASLDAKADVMFSHISLTVAQLAQWQHPIRYSNIDLFQNEHVPWHLMWQKTAYSGSVFVQLKGVIEQKQRSCRIYQVNKRVSSTRNSNRRLSQAFWWVCLNHKKGVSVVKTKPVMLNFAR